MYLIKYVLKMQPRHINLHPRTKLFLYRMKTESAKEGAERVSRRIHSVLLNSDGHTSGEISKLLSVSREKVSEWLKIYDQQGFDGLREGKRSGRPNLLTDLQKVLLCDIIDSGPVAYGLMTGIWTSTTIAEIIEWEFNVAYHPGHVRKLLQDFGFSVQSPKRLLAAADKEKRDRWISDTYPNIKKKPARKVRGSSSKTKQVSGKTQLSTELGHE
jgi:transposase